MRETFRRVCELHHQFKTRFDEDMNRWVTAVHGARKHPHPFPSRGISPASTSVVVPSSGVAAGGLAPLEISSLGLFLTRRTVTSRLSWSGPS